MSETARPHVFSDDYYERLAHLEEHHWWGVGVRAIQQRLLKLIPPPVRPWHVLDAGCGTGLTLNWIGDQTTIEPVGIDRAAAALQFCIRRGHHRVLQADATQLPLASGRFDLVLSCDVLQHLPRPGGDRLAFAEMARVLAPGGHLLLRTNSRCGYPDDENVLDYHRYTLGEVRKGLEAAGLRPVRLSYVNSLPGLALTIRRKLGGQRVTGTDPGLAATPQHNAVVETLLCSILKFEGLFLKRFDTSLPFGHSVIALAVKP